MAKDELIDRLHRIYAAIDETVEGDLTQFPPTVISNDKAFAIYQDFLGGLNAAQLSNLAHGVIHNIANLEDHLRRWAPKNGHDPQRIATLFKNSPPLQIVKDLSNKRQTWLSPAWRWSFRKAAEASRSQSRSANDYPCKSGLLRPKFATGR